MRTLPRRVFNSPLVEFANFADGSFVNLIHLRKPYANGDEWAINTATKGNPCAGHMFKTFENAKAKFEAIVQAKQTESTLIQRGPKGISNKQKIKSLVTEMLTESHNAMINKIDKVLNSGAIDIEGWDEKHAPMILPKCIVMAIMQSEATQYEGRGTAFEKQVKKEVRNIRYFI